MSGLGPALAAIRDEFVDFDAHRCASLTAVTVRAISENTATTEAVLNQFGINVSVDQV